MLTDRLGARRIISTFAILLGTGTILMGTVETFWQAAASFAVVGIGGAAMWTPVITLVQRWFSVRKRGMALGILSTGFGLGFAAMGGFYPVIVARWNWHYCWYIMGIAALVMVVVDSCFSGANRRMWVPGPGVRQRKKAEQTTAAASQAKKGNYRETFSTPGFWMIGFSYFLIAGALYIVTTYMVDYARYNVGFTFEKASSLATVHGLGQLVGVLVIPSASDYIGRRMTIFLSNLFIAASILGVVLAGGNGVALFTCIAVLGAFYGATFPMYGAISGDYFRKEITGTVIGTLTAFYGIGAIIGHRAGGHIRDVTGSFSIPFTMALFAAVFSAILMFFSRPAKNR